MENTTIKNKIEALEKEVMDNKKKLTDLRKELKPEKVDDYTFIDVDGNNIKLSELFGSKNELLLVHNMGKNCPHCTLWADEYNGVAGHLESRVPFVVISPDDSNTMKEFANGRNWTFRIFSSKGSSFSKDIGFDNGSPLPGVSVFTKDANGNIYHNTSASFGPGDNYCSVWDYFDLLPKGSDGWNPKYSYN